MIPVPHRKESRIAKKKSKKCQLGVQLVSIIRCSILNTYKGISWNRKNKKQNIACHKISLCIHCNTNMLLKLETFVETGERLTKLSIVQNLEGKVSTSWVLSVL